MPDTEVIIHLPVAIDPEVKIAVNQDLGLVATFTRPHRGVQDTATYVVLGAAFGPLWVGMAERWGEQAADAFARVVGRLRRGRGAAGLSDVHLVDLDHPDVAFVIDDAAEQDASEALPALRRTDTTMYRPGVQLVWVPGAHRWAPRI